MASTDQWPAFGDTSDREPLRFQAFCADRLLHLLGPLPGERILEVGTGNGIFAIAAAQAVLPAGRVTAIDWSEELLAGLELKISQFGIGNIDVHRLDGIRTGFRREYFHHVVCSLGLHRFPDLSVALREWHRVLRPRGQLAMASLQTRAFAAPLDMLQRRVIRAGHAAGIPWQQTGERQLLESRLVECGFTDMVWHEAQLGYHLATPDQWWEVVEHGPLRHWLRPLSAAQRQQFRAGHLADVATLPGDKGLWLDVPVLLVLARRR